MFLALATLVSFIPSGFSVGVALIPPVATWKGEFLIPPAGKESPNDFYSSIPIVGTDNVTVKVKYHGADKSGNGTYPLQPKLSFTMVTPDHKMVFGGMVDSPNWSTSQSPANFDRVGDWTFDFQRTDLQRYWLKGEVSVTTSEPKSELKNIKGEKGTMFETTFTANGSGIYVITGSYGYDVAFIEQGLRSTLTLATEGSEFYLHTGVGEQAVMLTVTPAGAAKGRVVKLTLQTDKIARPVVHNLKVIFYPTPNIANWTAYYRNNPK